MGKPYHCVQFIKAVFFTSSCVRIHIRYYRLCALHHEHPMKSKVRMIKSYHHSILNHPFVAVGSVTCAAHL